MENQICMADKDWMKARIKYEPTMGFLVLVLRMRQMYNLITRVTALSVWGAAPGKPRPGGIH